MKMRNSGIVLFVCSGLLLAGGAVLGGSAGWQVLRMSYYFWTSDFGAELGAGVQLIAGAMLCLPACWLASLVPYHPRSFSLLTTMMFLASASMIVLCIALSSLGGLSRVLREPDAVNSSMHRALARATLDPSVRSAFSSMQLELRCCGVNNPSDWLKYRRTLPAACCKRWVHPGKDLLKREPCESAVFTSGCLTPALSELRYYVNSQAILSATMIFVLGVTLFATAYTLVIGMMERGDLYAGKPSPPAPLRVACLSTPTHIYSLLPEAPNPVVSSMAPLTPTPTSLVSPLNPLEPTPVHNI